MTEQPVTPIDPGPLVMSDHELTTWDGWVLASLHNRPDWPGYAAWLVRASNEFSALVEVASASIRYDAALIKCVNDPTKYMSFRTVGDKTLDDLYDDLITKARAVVGET